MTIDNVKVSAAVEAISGLSASELKTLKDDLYARFNIKEYEAMPIFTPVTKVEEVEEQTEFDVILTSAGDSKLNVIKVVRELTSLGLKESKDLVDNVPRAIKEAVSIETANKIKESIVAVGGVVLIK